jgi:hypothetical protein
MAVSRRKASGKTGDTHVKGATPRSGMDTAVKQLAEDVRELKEEVRQLKKLIDPDLILDEDDLRSIAAAENDLRNGKTRRL